MNISGKYFVGKIGLFQGINIFHEKSIFFNYKIYVTIFYRETERIKFDR